MNLGRAVDADHHNATRQTVSLDGVWQFRFEDGDWREAHVPQPWQAEFDDLFDSFGHAVYKRSFTVPANFAGKDLALRFAAVAYACEVYLNGTKIGDHEGAYLPFECAIDPALLRAENEVEVRVTTPSADQHAFPEYPFSEVPHGKMSWYGRMGGLWQSVSLEARNKKRLTSLTITANMHGTLVANLGFTPAASGLEAKIVVRDDAGKAVAESAAAASEAVDVALAVANAKLWDVFQPNLYTLTVTLGNGEDEVTETFGFRTVTTENGSILLNGKPVYMRGALDQDYYPEGIYTAPSLEFLEDQAQKAIELGLNTLRCHIKIPDPRYYDVADRFGLLVWTEVPNVAIFTTDSARRMRETMEGILQRDRNHPSIIAWTLINEDWGTRLVENAEHRQWLKDSYEWLKAEDPTRLVVDNSACFPNWHVKTDLNDFHYYRSVPERRQEWDDLTAQFAAGADWTYSPLGDAERRGDEPLIVSEFGVWGLPNPKLLRGENGKEPTWFETGSLWGDGVGLPHGIEQRFAALDLYRTFGDFDQFIDKVQWYQFMNLRYEIEEMRRYSSIQGYVITELTDVHWEANGLLDIERNPRVFHDVFGTINADIVIVPRPERYSAYSGQQLALELRVATGGLSIPAGAVLHWSGDISDSINVPATGPVSVADLGNTMLTMPKVSTNKELTLSFSLEAGGSVLATNTCTIALYAERKTADRPTIAVNDAALGDYARGLGYEVVDKKKADIVLVHAVNGEDVDAMKAGAKYLILADGSVKTNHNLRTDMPDGELPHRSIVADGKQFKPAYDHHLPNINLVERDGTIWRGDWIAGFSWLRRDGVFADIPGGPIFDLSFSGVVPLSLLTGFKPWEFGNNVQSGIVCGWVHKPAAIIGKKQIGRGGVVATTFRLTREAPGADPVAAALLDRLISATAGLSQDV
ncbi:glycoside hydrolase family 2 TIM barrel-domain containing protein [Devosia sp. MC521]|uniref:glycoside hydrolase family 2 protein n=1 Tax=Devosia sp. MC521 TaxID=2759954 RepID=UPI0015FBF737|nr:glycoside hydrolase family 2 TIM barrel-domain containing protein [Devosia sp. MC521]MBJ6985907.1 glycoside hydrolase family 2 [Devosia sp. MC521]QMW61284.1 glycoside hydrolase family 2 [Devosia sp. MC521]